MRNGTTKGTRVTVRLTEELREKMPSTHYQSPSSLYRLTPTTEEIVRKLAQQWRPEPVSVYDLPRLPAPTSPFDAELAGDHDGGPVDRGEDDV